MGESSLGTPPPVRPVEDRLDSWKEIAAYLKRDVTTVQRWEKREGMPVHRHLHDRMGSVYAFSSELDAWAHSRRLRLEEEEKELRAEPPADEEADVRPTGTSQARLWLVLGGVAALALYCLHLRYPPEPRWASDPSPKSRLWPSCPWTTCRATPPRNTWLTR